jgi:hypothetical protein
MSDMLRGQANMANFDAICTFVFKDYKDFAKFMLSLDPFHAGLSAEHLGKLTIVVGRYDPASKALTPDHDNFMVEEDMQMLIGDE